MLMRGRAERTMRTKLGDREMQDIHAGKENNQRDRAGGSLGQNRMCSLGLNLSNARHVLIMVTREIKGEKL